MVIRKSDISDIENITEVYGKVLTEEENGCKYLRMDTNEKNTNARRLYKKLGYREADILPCTFNGIEGVRLVCLEKMLG